MFMSHFAVDCFQRNVEEEDGSEESSQPQRKHRNSEEGMGNGGGGAGSNGNGGSGSGRRRSGGFSNLGSQVMPQANNIA